MNYYQKYIKYKNKYLLLKKNKYDNIQYGGEQPEVYVLKDISPLSDPNMDLLLNPIYGFLWNFLGPIENYFNFRTNDNIYLLHPFTKKMEHFKIKRYNCTSEKPLIT